MVSGKDDAVCFSDGYPTGSLKGLCCLVDKECGKSPAGQDTVVTACLLYTSPSPRDS